MTRLKVKCKECGNINDSILIKIDSECWYAKLYAEGRTYYLSTTQAIGHLNIYSHTKLCISCNKEIHNIYIVSKAFEINEAIVGYQIVKQ